MNTFKNDVKGNFTIVPNGLINNTELSAKAKGLYLYLASKPNTWKFYMDEIKTNFTDGISAIKSGIKELEEFGYLTRKRVYDHESKRIVGWEWHLHKEPTNRTENLPTCNDTQKERGRYNNTDSSKTDISNTNPTPHRGDGEFLEVIEHWNECHNTDIRATNSKKKQYLTRLKTFSIDEIKTAIRNRSQSDWIRGEGASHASNWDSLFRNDDQIDKYLNMKPKKEPEKAKPNYGYNMPREYWT